MNTKGETVELWHSLLNPTKDPEKWYGSIKEEGLQPDGGNHLRDNAVYFHKPDESVYDTDIMDFPAIEAEVPASLVYGTELTKCDTEGEFCQEEWEEHLTPYEDFDPNGPSEYVVIGGLAPDFIEGLHESGPPYEAESHVSGWGSTKIEEAELGKAAGLFT